MPGHHRGLILEQMSPNCSLRVLLSISRRNGLWVIVPMILIFPVGMHCLLFSLIYSNSSAIVEILQNKNEYALANFEARLKAPREGEGQKSRRSSKIRKMSEVNRSTDDILASKLKGFCFFGNTPTTLTTIEGYFIHYESRIPCPYMELIDSVRRTVLCGLIQFTGQTPIYRSAWGKWPLQLHYYP